MFSGSKGGTGRLVSREEEWDSGICPACPEGRDQGIQ